METKHLKKYAPEARRDFIAAVKNKAAVYGLLPKEILPMKEEGDVVIIGDRPFPRTVAKQRKELEERIRKEGFQQFIEAVAYTWFNRFVAIRYMELHGYLDHGYRVLSHPEGKATPEILENAERVELPGLKRDEVVDLKLDGGKDEQLYQLLLLAQCNALHKAMPFLFESIKDGTELLLPDNLLHTDSLVRTLVNDIPDEQWENVEIIGWLYQFYISERKDEVIGKVVKSEDIPAATQLFTPNWIVRYMLHNTLGRQWMATYPDSPLKQQMEFYIEPAEQTPEVQQQLKEVTPDSLNPEELTLLDPACGSGHILVEAYDLFKAIYTERGYRVRDIPTLILTRNLFGLEIDDRASQLAAFALMMKARVDDRTIFGRGLEPHVVSIQESKGLNISEITEALNAALPDGSTGDISELTVAQLIERFEYGKTFGSLLQVPNHFIDSLSKLSQRCGDVSEKGGLFERQSARSLYPILTQARLLAQTFSVVVANPPYMGRGGKNAQLNSFLEDQFPDAKNDLFACFMERSLSLCTSWGRIGIVAPFVWMFISSYAKLRTLLLKNASITTLVQLEYNAFEPACIPVATFTLIRGHVANLIGGYIRLSEFTGHQNQAPRALQAISDQHCGWFHATNLDKLSSIPGTPIAYWLSEGMLRAFSEGTPIRDICRARLGIYTGDNTKFIRHWFEVDSRYLSRLEGPSRTTRWVPYNKGGAARRWANNTTLCVFWENDGAQIRQNGTINSEECFYKPGITWSGLTSSTVTFRHTGPGHLFDSNKGAMVFPPPDLHLFLLGFLNSRVVDVVLGALNPTLSTQNGDIDRIPVPMGTSADHRSAVVSCVRNILDISDEDWQSNEVAPQFDMPSLLKNRSHSVNTLAACYSAVTDRSKQMVSQIASLEEHNNRLFIEALGLDKELACSTPPEDITLLTNPAHRYGMKLTEDERWQRFRTDTIEELVSFAVGCVLGRFSLDEPGVIYADSANEGFLASRYNLFSPDEDGIIPVTDVAWFTDDAANRFVDFIKTAWPEEYFVENLNFVAESLGKKRNETAQECVRRYFASGFFKNHLSMYKKRPIYWLFSSGKQRAFQCLVYLHRYNAGTLSRMRTEYVVKLQGKINARIEQLENDIATAGSTSHRKKLEKERDTLTKQQEELQTFDEKLRHYADQRIELDLDDGVRVNYGKFGDLLAEVKTVTGGASE